MRRVYTILAICLAVTISCQKQLDKPEEANATSESVGKDSCVPDTITGTIFNVDNKTAYDDEGKFSWEESDQVRLLVYSKGSTNYSPQGWSTYTVSSRSDENKTAVFKNNNNNIVDFSSDDYTSTNIAVYPASIARPKDGGTENHGYGAPFITVPQKVNGTTNEIILTGTPLGDNSNFRFRTAMSVLRITVNNIPANAAQLRLATDKDTNPIDGDFKLLDNGSGIVELTKDRYSKYEYSGNYYHSAHDYIYVDLSGVTSAIDSRDFYFNLPTGEYPANTLSIQIADANGTIYFKKTISKAITMERGECLAMPALTVKTSITVTGTVTEPRMTMNYDGRTARFNINQSSTNVPSDYKNGNMWSNNSMPATYSNGANIKSFGCSNSGLYYLHYMICSDNTNKPSSLTDANVISYGSIPFYFLSSADQTSFVGELTTAFTDGGASRVVNPAAGTICHPGTSAGYEGKMTLAASDDVTKGNIMLTKLYKQTPDTGHQLYGILDTNNNTLVFPYAGDTNQDYFFVAWNGNAFHVASCSTVTFNGDRLSSTANGDLLFTISEGKLTHSDYLMMKYAPSTYAYWDAFVYGKGLVFSK